MDVCAPACMSTHVPGVLCVQNALHVVCMCVGLVLMCVCAVCTGALHVECTFVGGLVFMCVLSVGPGNPMHFCFPQDKLLWKVRTCVAPSSGLVFAGLSTHRGEASSFTAHKATRIHNKLSFLFSFFSGHVLSIFHASAMAAALAVLSR